MRHSQEFLHPRTNLGTSPVKSRRANLSAAKFAGVIHGVYLALYDINIFFPFWVSEDKIRSKVNLLP